MRKSMDYKGIKKAVQIISITLIVLIGVFSLLGALIEHAWVMEHFEEAITRRDMIEDIIIGSLFLADALVLVLAKNKTVKKVMQIMSAIIIIIAGGYLALGISFFSELSGMPSSFSILNYLPYAILIDGILFLVFSLEKEEKELPDVGSPGIERQNNEKIQDI